MLSIILALAAWPAAAFAAAPVCRDVPGADELWRKPAVGFVVFGEAHGTKEIPALFGDVVCQASASRTVVVALEWPQEMQASLDDYMASDGSRAARKRSLSAPFWSNRTPDGRTSQAMFDLIERLRRLRASGRPVSVKAFAPPPELLRFRQDYYELEMARNLAHIANDNPARPLVLVLTGNVHAGKRRADASRGGLLGAVGHLPPVEVVSLDAARNGGEEWACGVDKPLRPGVELSLKDISCGAKPWPPSPQGVAPRGITIAPIMDGMYDGVFSTGAPTTASPPAKTDDPAPPPGR
jgi:hypothetical protein